MLRYLMDPVVNWLNQEKSRREFPLSDYDKIRYELKPCDVLLIEGTSRVSEIIKLITQSPWSHAALYVGRVHDIEDPALRRLVGEHHDGDPGDQLVIESMLGHGTIVRTLDVYRQDHMRICRPSGITHPDAQRVLRYAVSRLGVDYDVRQIFDLARFFFPWWILPRRFRSSLFRHNPGRSTRTVCSTMIAEAFSFVQFPILPLMKAVDSNESAPVQMFRRNPKLCTPSDFDYSPYFEIIKYPFVGFTHGQDYHLLPWDGTGELDSNEAELYIDSALQPTSDVVDEAIDSALARLDEPFASVDVEAEESGDESGQTAAPVASSTQSDADTEPLNAGPSSPGPSSPGPSTPDCVQSDDARPTS